jgi:hypothetical protein
MDKSNYNLLLELINQAGFSNDERYTSLENYYLCTFDEIVTLVDSLYETDFGGFRRGADAEADAGDRARVKLNEYKIREVELKREIARLNDQVYRVSLVLDEAVNQGLDNDYVFFAQQQLETVTLCSHSWIPYLGAMHEGNEVCTKCYKVQEK